jgi:serine/threonine-protein kinase
MNPRQVAADAMPPRLGRYRLLRPLGGGATSVVYAAHDDGNDRDVAVKVIAPDLVGEREARVRFYREAMVTSELRHRNIVAVLDVSEHEGRPFLVMELLQGEPLEEHLRRESAQSIRAKLDLIIQLHEGLLAAHHHQVVHRDIKPSNLFVEDNGCLKILDFGLARLQASTLTASGQILGTPDFMSPEQAEGKRVDSRSDIFSAASVSYYVLSGQSPFTRANLQQTVMALLQESPAPLTETETPESLWRVLLKSFAKNPDERYQRCTDVLADLDRVRFALEHPAAGRGRGPGDGGVRP